MHQLLLKVRVISRYTVTMGNNKSKKAFIKQIPAPPKQAGEIDNIDKISARVVAIKGPFVDAHTGELLRRFYAKHAPDKEDEWIAEHIKKIIASGMPIAGLNELLKDKYQADLRDLE